MTEQSDHPDWREMARDYDEREAAAGPRSATLTESLSRSIETAYQRGRAEAAAGPREAYVRGHWDGLNCEANGFGGRLDECEHVGRIHEPRAEAAAGPRDEGLRPWLRHHVSCAAKTDDPPTAERCDCGLRAALAKASDHD